MSIKPALTPEEWEGRRVEERVPNQYIVSAGWPTSGVSLSRGLSRDQKRMHHALAALCLHGQPFGFTREDVDLIRDAAAMRERIARKAGNGTGGYSAPRLRDLADRIEALLPPEDA